MKYENNTTRCCCCISLERGVKYITILTLFTTAYAVFKSISSLQSYDYRDIVLVYLVINSLFLLALIFGLFVCCCAKTAYLLRAYSTLYNIFTVVEVLYTIVVIIILILDKENIIESCRIGIISSNHSYIDPISTCNSLYNQVQIITIVAYALSTLIVIHFAMVISAYAARCRDNEKRLQPVT
ncbi:17104_t:CDS:2 [Dentiscutata erythropus]|uniref:17104_t:CDS:1 n=1 Tax=Dentiscutata erythropus TaxID=1348616 RepID=A0A9N8ZMH2_9GLOM|nr:17104_t:CDS:2 [Dentiscutata erythropus]